MSQYCAPNDDIRPILTQTLIDPAMARDATRTFQLLPPEESWRVVEWSQSWPNPSKSSDLTLNLYDYYQHYVLVCPCCGHLWCRVACSKPPDALWSVRSRWCDRCLPAYVEHQHRLFSGLMVNSMHCPGTVLSFDDRLLGEGADPETWMACLDAMPEPHRHREILLWCQFDALCNPSEPSQ